MIKFLIEVDSIIIGINLWFIPQISEHCPKNIPGRIIKINVWFIRPGTASILIPKDGIVHEWITSFDVVNIRIGVLKGKIIRLSTSNNRNCDLLLELNGIIYESKLMFL